MIVAKIRGQKSPDCLEAAFCCSSIEWESVTEYSNVLMYAV